jgi:hypothetical protein
MTLSGNSYSKEFDGSSSIFWKVTRGTGRPCLSLFWSHERSLFSLNSTLYFHRVLLFNNGAPSKILGSSALMSIISQIECVPVGASFHSIFPMSRNSRRRSARRSRFIPEEDELLRRLVDRFGSHNWRCIKEFFPDRNIRQCRDRCRSLSRCSTFHGLCPARRRRKSVSPGELS